MSLVTSSCVVVTIGDMAIGEEAVEIGDWLGGGDEAGTADLVDRGDEVRLSTLAARVDLADACKAEGANEPEDEGELDATGIVDDIDTGATHLVQIVEVEIRIMVESCVVICSVGIPLEVITWVTGHEVKVVYTLWLMLGSGNQVADWDTYISVVTLSCVERDRAVDVTGKVLAGVVMALTSLLA